MKSSEVNVCPAVEVPGVAASEVEVDRVSRDSLLEHWLETPPPRRPPSSRPPPSGERITLVPIGDTVADGWFR